MKTPIASIRHLLLTMALGSGLCPVAAQAGAFYNYEPMEVNARGVERPLWRYVWREAGQISQVACVLEKNNSKVCHWDAPITMSETEFMERMHRLGAHKRYSIAGGLLLEKYQSGRDALIAAGESSQRTGRSHIVMAIETLDGKKTFNSGNGDILQAWVRSLKDDVYVARRLRSDFDQMYRLFEGREESNSDSKYSEAFMNIRGHSDFALRTRYSAVDEAFIQYAVDQFEKTGERMGFLKTIAEESRLRARTSAGEWVLVAEFPSELTRSSYDRYSNESFEFNPTHFHYTCAQILGSDWRAPTFQELEKNREEFMKTSLYRMISAHPYVFMESFRTLNKYGRSMHTKNYNFKGEYAKRTTLSMIKESFVDQVVYRAQNVYEYAGNGVHRLCYRAR